MGLFGNFMNKFTNKFTNRASDKLADKAINKIFGGNKQSCESKNITEQNTVQPDNTVNNESEIQKQQADNTVNNESEIQKQQAENYAQMAATNAMMQRHAVNNGMAQMNEIMSYFVFGKDMEIVGVKPDAPDWVKQAYEQGEFNTKD